MTAARYSLPRHIAERLQQLSVLRTGTGVEDQLPITPRAHAIVAEVLASLATAAPQALEAVFIASAHNGGVTLEWDTDDDRQLIVTVPPREGCQFSIFRYSVEPRIDEDRSEENLASLPELLSWLTNGDGGRGRQLVNVREIEARWDERFATTGDVLVRLAGQALAGERAGRIVLLDLHDR